MIEYRKYLFVLLMALVNAGAYSAAANVSSGSGTTGNGVLVYPPTTTNASANVTMIANSFVVVKLGRSYFNSYIHLVSAYTYSYQNGTNVSYMYYHYTIPFANGTNTTGTLQYGGLLALLGVGVAVTNGRYVSSYWGPEQPFVISVSKRAAISNATAYGLANASSGSITATHYLPTADPISDKFRGYRVVWAVLSGSRIYPNNTKYGIYPGVYVDVNSAKILGQYVYNPYILAASGNGNSTTATLGAFNLFGGGNPTQNSTTISGAGGTSGSGGSKPQQSWYITAIELVAVAAVVVIAYIVVSQRKRY